MIPKTIHYCWFGGNPLPVSARKYIQSWKKFFPDYKIVEWNESSFDVNSIPYTTEAYRLKKYAFVSDYARFWILYHQGGIYFDIDVEVIKSFDGVLEKGSFMGFEMIESTLKGVNPGLGMGSIPNHPFLKKMLDLYDQLSFLDADGKISYKTIVDNTTDMLISDGLVLENKEQDIAGFTIYPTDYFCPLPYGSNECTLTSNTKSIHHYNDSWKPMSRKIKNKIFSLIGHRMTMFLVNVKHFVLHKNKNS